jgi:hypothetical protein
MPAYVITLIRQEDCILKHGGERGKENACPLSGQPNTNKRTERHEDRERIVGESQRERRLTLIVHHDLIEHE